MGVGYVLVPLDLELESYLHGIGVALPEPGWTSRNPTPTEVRGVCSHLPGSDAEFVCLGDGWSVDLSDAVDPQRGPWTSINVVNFSGDEDRPHVVGFSKGWPSVILQVSLGLALLCGPLILWPDTGDEPIVVTGHVPVPELMAAWSFLKPVADP